MPQSEVQAAAGVVFCMPLGGTSFQMVCQSCILASMDWKLHWRKLRSVAPNTTPVMSSPPSLLQTRVSGLQFGKWGRDKYGTKPVKVDTIEFLADRLQELEKEIKEQQVGQDCCGHPNLSQITSCACWTRAVSHTCCWSMADCCIHLFK